MIGVDFGPGASSPKPVSRAWVRTVVRAVLSGEKSKKTGVNIYLTDNRQIREMNRKFLNHDYATDVISFGRGPEAFLGEAPDFLGEVVVSVTMARDTAKDLKIPFKQELARYLVHGTLHLLGYKDASVKERTKMFTIQEKIVEKIIGSSRTRRGVTRSGDPSGAEPKGRAPMGCAAAARLCEAKASLRRSRGPRA